MTDPAARLRRVREIFDAVIDTPVAERAAMLDLLSSDDPALRREVEELLTTAEGTITGLRSQFTPAPGRDAASLVGQRLGAYDVVRLIGMGGMGAVYEAVRGDDQYRKRVAIKVVQRGIDSDSTLARFRRERQILASLEHPNIATLLDGGVTSDGRPYLVMEYVDGEPITRWCDAHATSVRDRIALFRQVCAAVRYAHKNLVVHRDLKPGNILVAHDGTAKLLDFGIAKLLATGDEDDSALPLTRGGAAAFTPEYASPEQIRGDVLSTASDVYSLGVVLFELLCGRRPYRPRSLAQSLVETELAVLEQPVPRSSAVITDPRRPSAAASGDRLRRTLRGELDNIALTALRREPAERYGSVEALDDDLQRYLDGEPVRAHRDWAGYRVRKFVQRNTAVVVASGLVVVALVGGVITTAIQSHRAHLAQVKEQHVNSFLTTLLSSIKPVTGGRDVTANELLDAATRRLEVDRDTPPDIRAELQAVLSLSYHTLGRYAEAEHLDSSALHLHEQLEGPNSIGVITALSSLSQDFMNAGDLDLADTINHRALAMKQAQSSRPDSLLSSLLVNMGSLAHNRGDPKTAETYHRQALAIRRQLFGDINVVVALSLSDVAVTLGEQGRLADAEPLSREAVAVLRKLHPEGSIELAGALNALAGALDLQEKSLAADSAYRETLALQKKLLGADHPDYAMTMMNYSGFLFDQHRYAEAEAGSRELLALRGKTLPESHVAISVALQTLGFSLDHQGDSAGARAALEESLELRRRYMGPTTWMVASSEGVLGDHFTGVKDSTPRQKSSCSTRSAAFPIQTSGADQPPHPDQDRASADQHSTPRGRSPTKVAEYRGAHCRNLRP